MKDGKEVIYESKAKIILDGLGADEFFGGYARYKKNTKMQMMKDIDRMWIRNLGRDDRVCGDTGVEIRYPYIDKNLLFFLRNTSLDQITDFSMPRGSGEKFILRLLASSLGFKHSQKFEKRAIQFGSGIAKKSNVSMYGCNCRANGRAQIDELEV